MFLVGQAFRGVVIDSDDEGIGIETGCHRLRTLVLVVVCHVGLIRWVEMDVSPFITDPGFVAIDPLDVIPVEAFSAGLICLVRFAKGFKSFD